MRSWLIANAWLSSKNGFTLQGRCRVEHSHLTIPRTLPARGAAGWPGRAATASRPAGHPASHAEKRAGRLEKTGRPTAGRPAGRPAKNRPAKTGWPTGWPAGRPPALTD